MNNVGLNIRKLREKRGFSQEYMAAKLGVAQASYARMENAETKITIERLGKIAELLETDITELFDSSRLVVQSQTNNEGAYGNHGYVENLHIEHKETYEKLIAQYEQRLKDKDEQIALLKGGHSVNKTQIPTNSL